MMNATYCSATPPPSSCPFLSSSINTAAMNLLNAKLPNGQYLIPSPNLGLSATQAKDLGFDAIAQGPNSQSTVNQAIGSVDYVLSAKDRLSAKYYFQSDPTTNPFGAVGSLLGFSQQLEAGSQVVSLSNTRIISPNLTWEQHFGFTRLRAYANTEQGFSPGSMGISLLGSATFPQFDIKTSDPQIATGLEFGPSTSFGDAGMFQNQWGGGSTLNWLKGKNTISFGGEWDRTQLNVINNNTNTDTLNFTSFQTFVEGSVRSGTAFAGSADRYY